jgi:muramoyltetrapeptide carboxypeptidase
MKSLLGKSAEEIILSICLDYNFPIAFNFPAGHVEDNRALIMGREVSLEIDKTNVKLKFKDRKYQ